MKKYKAKIDLALFIPVVAIMLGSTLPMIFMAMNEADSAKVTTGWGSALLMLALTAFCIHLFLKTHYVIDADNLIVHAGILYKKKIPVAAVRKIMETRNPISAPAPSLDRIEIFYNRFDSVVISPKDKIGLIADLTRLNPDIEVVYRSP